MVGMTVDQLRALASAPTDVSAELVALWHDSQGHWDHAHEVVQELETPDAAWVHAYLHRKEGDQSNARYWYSRAGQPVFRGTLDEEWAHIVTALLAH
jgi:hypothetical protein